MLSRGLPVPQDTARLRHSKVQRELDITLSCYHRAERFGNVTSERRYTISYAVKLMGADLCQRVISMNLTILETGENYLSNCL